MPKLNRNFHLDITPEQFVNACSPIELYELNLLLSAPNYQDLFRDMEEDPFKPVKINPLIKPTH